MIKRYLLTAKKEDKTNYETFFTIRSAEYRQLEFIHCGYKTKIIPLDFDLTYQEIDEHYKNEIEKVNILNDFLYILKEHHGVSEDDFNNIEEDIDIIYLVFKKCEDSDLSHWENIERAIEYLKDIKNTHYDYSKIN